MGPRFPGRADRPLILAHRGASADAPENTLAAFREALRQGADGVELDVKVCASGEVVVCHDEWLDRLAGEHLELRALTLPALSRLDVGRRFGSRFSGERIPTLDEVLAALPRDKLLNVELKSEGLRDHGLCAAVVRALARDGARHPVVVSSFNPLCLVRVRALAPHVPTGLLFDRSQGALLRNGLLAPLVATASLHPEEALCTADAVRRFRRLGYSVVAWTVDEEAEVARCCRVRVDAIITNRPAAVRCLVARHAS
jgi:glycerophosphoryl diester phosphodiesterase